MKTLNKILKLDKEKFKIPKCVQDIIPIKAIWEDGIFQVSKNKFSKSYKFMDINYAVASKEDKEAMFLEYSDLLNSLDVGAITKITINNRRISWILKEQYYLMKVMMNLMIIEKNIIKCLYLKQKMQMKLCKKK